MAQSNRLSHQKSPYLLQHADNPVDWYPWSEEAFNRAKREDKPIFLSIGYSTCHWCHVMEHESFEDPEVAQTMNEVYVCIKVDREERPDIDSIYMNVCQAMTGSGGWPLSIVMTPEKKPFFAGTYIPKHSVYGRIGMIELAARIKEIWHSRRGEINDTADKIVSNLWEISERIEGEKLDEETLDKTYAQLNQRFDHERGGFGDAPKFPTPHNFFFLLRYWRRTGQSRALEMVEKSLQNMRLGGIYDHVGFGFHRYSTDRYWFLPHFEKMLYDQALLMMAYTETYLATKKEDYKQTAHEIITYVLRDMIHPEGGFYSAEDADSEGVEGKFYLWSVNELRQHLTTEDAELMIRVYNCKQGGNYVEETGHHFAGLNIVHLDKSLAETAYSIHDKSSDLIQTIERIRQKLFAMREKRIHPHKDDKILTDWNGLMIAALSKAGQAFHEPAYKNAACRSADFILKKLRRNDGRLLHRFRDEEAAISGFIDDYAFFIWGLIEIYEATFKVQYLQDALNLANEMISLFWDNENGGFFFAAEDNESLIARQKEVYDGAVPSGNSVAMMDLLRLGRITSNQDFENKAIQICKTFSSTIHQIPSAFTQLVSAVDFLQGPSYEVIIAGKDKGEDTSELIDAIHSNFLPNIVLLYKPTDEESPEISHLLQSLQHHSVINGKAAAYVCRNFTCNKPTTDSAEMLKMLNVKGL